MQEEQLLRHDLYLADEAFLTGTAAEVVPIRSVDDRVIGDPGEITRKLQETYFAAVRGQVEQYKDWLRACRLNQHAEPRPDAGPRGSRSTTRRCATGASSRASR